MHTYIFVRTGQSTDRKQARHFRPPTVNPPTEHQVRIAELEKWGALVVLYSVHDVERKKKQ